MVNEQQVAKLQQRLRDPEVHGIQKTLKFAVLILMVNRHGEFHFIFEKRSSMVPQGGEVSFPGGRFEPDNDRDSKETAIRETIEELGIPQEKITVIGQLDTFITPWGAEVDGYVGIADINSLDELKIQAAEMDYAFSVPVSFFVDNRPAVYDTIVKVHPSYLDKNGNEVLLFPAKELGLPERYCQPWGNGINEISVYKYGNEIIWGMTARFVNNFVEKLK